MPAGDKIPFLGNKFSQPSVHLRSDEGQKTYTALLERRLLHLTRQNLLLRAVAEYATGVPYDSFDHRDMTQEDIQEHVAQDFARGLNLSLTEARSRVAENAQTANFE